MKKIIASAGIVALGATAVHAGIDPSFDQEDGKVWNVSTTLRGFYDDNYNTQPSNAKDSAGHRLKDGSYGFEVSPKAMVRLSNDQTDFGAQYIYSARYYEDRDSDKTDQSHQLDLSLKHRFNERYSLLVADSFVVAQEPELIDPNLSTPTRADGDNIRNNGTINFGAGLTERFGLAFGYRNNFYDYQNDLSSAESAAFNGGTVSPSRSGLLDRIEQLANVDLLWRVREKTTAILGYQFGWSDYTGDEPIAIDPVTTENLESDVRNNRSHYAYVGMERDFSDSLHSEIRIGGRYNDYYNTSNDETDFSPYVKMTTRYTYQPGSYLEFGSQHDRNATDVVSPDSKGHVTTDQESTTIYATLNHKITPKLTGNLLGQFQHSEFDGGSADGDSDNFFLAGVNLNYRFNHHFSTEVGYNYDRLDSDSPDRSYSRNRVYVGVTAAY